MCPARNMLGGLVPIALALFVAGGAFACAPSTPLHDGAPERDRAAQRDREFDFSDLPDRSGGERGEREFDHDLDRNRGQR